MENSISYEEFLDLMFDPNTTETEIEKYIEIDRENSEGYQIAFKFKEGVIRNLTVESALVLNAMNAWYRRKRNNKYEEKVNNGYNGKIIVSEGDSWFQYPKRLYDVIDHISDNYAVYSLGAAGDWLQEIIKQNDYIKAIKKEKASIFIISGGGNDLVGSERIMKLIKPFKQDRPPEKYLGKNFNSFSTKIEEQYRHIFTTVSKEFPEVKILCHGYDYSIPNNGKWFGKPMKKIGIEDKILQRKISHHITDRFNNLISRVSKDFPSVSYIDCRNIVGENRWYDELHPNNEGFKDVAQKFITIIEQ